MTLKIDVPTQAAASNHRQPQYISPATTQLSVDIQSGCPGACASATGFPTTVGLTPTSNGCSSTLASTQCILTLALLPGTYVGTFTTLDASNAVLSTAQNVAISIVAGTANVVAVALSGIPASLVTSSIGNGEFLVTALDSDNDAIIGPGAPTFTIAHTGGDPIAIHQPTATSQNVFYAHPFAVGSSTISVTATYAAGVTNACTQTGAQCTHAFTLSSSASSSAFSMFVADYLGAQVLEFNAPLGGAAVAKATTGVGNPNYAAANAQGNLFAATGGHIVEYAPPFTGNPIATITSAKITTPQGIAFDSTDTMYVSDSSSGSVIAFTPPYTGAGTVAISGLGAISQLAFDRSDNLFVVDQSLGAVAEFAPPAYSSVAGAVSVASASGVTLDAQGDVFLLGGNDGTSSDGFLYESSPFGTAPTTVASGIPSPKTLTMDLAGNVYFVNYDGYVGEISPPFPTTATPVIQNISDPLSVTLRNNFTTTVQ